MFRSFGPLTVTIGSRPVAVQSGRQRALLTALLLGDGQVVSADRLAECVWSRDVPGSAHQLIHTHIWRLRQLLSAEAKRLATWPPGYLLTAQAGEYDVADFLCQVRAGRAALALGQPETAATTLAVALALWQGEPFADVPPHDYFEQVALGLAEERLAAKEDWFEAQLLLGHSAALIADLPALVREHPLRERLVCQLMLAFYRNGRQSEALAAFHRLRTALADELGIDPGRETQVRFESVLRGDPSLDQPHPDRALAARPAGPSADGSAAAGGRTVTPGPAGTRRRPAQLPADVPGFTGRSRALGWLDQLIRGASAPVTAVISGTAGVGKTALAVRCAQLAAGQFPDGQLYVDLHGWSAASPLRPAAALGQLLRGLGLPAAQVPPDPDEAASLYRSMVCGQRILVLLDNARDADQVRLLLPGAPGCPAVITSRSRMTGLIATHGAHRLDLPPLGDEDASALLGTMLGRRRAAAEPQAVRELARLCGYLPLALRIAAAKADSQPAVPISDCVAELRHVSMLARLQIDGDELAGFRVAIGHSYAALSPAEQRWFRRLGAAAHPDLTIGSIAELIGLPLDHARWLAERLAEAQLLQHAGSGRFRLPDLTREFARELDGEAEGARQHGCRGLT